MLGLSPLVWIMIFQYLGLAVSLGYYVWRYRLKIGYTAVFVVPDMESGVKVSDGSYTLVETDKGVAYQPLVGSSEKLYTIVGEQDFKARDEWISFNKKSFPVDIGKVSIRKRGISYIYYDFENECIINFGGEFHCAGDARINDYFMAGNIFKQFFDLLRSMSKTQLMMLLLVALGVGSLCFVVGVFVSPHIMPQPVAVSGGGV